MTDLEFDIFLKESRKKALKLAEKYSQEEIQDMKKELEKQWKLLRDKHDLLTHAWNELECRKAFGS